MQRRNGVLQRPHLRLSAWLLGEGHKGRNEIKVAANQPVSYSEDYNASINLRWAHGIGDSTIEPADSHADGFTFTIGDDGSLTLEGTTEFKMGAENYFIGLFWSDNNEYAIYGDALTVYKPINIVTQVDVLPYVNNFTTMGDQQSFTIVDGNEDNSTWYPFDGKFSHFGSYDYDADDWLISPAIKLEAGKNYYVSMTRGRTPMMPKRPSNSRWARAPIPQR